MRGASESGFTLVELMIVVLIVGVLAAIAIPNYVAMQDRSKEGSTKVNMHNFQLAAEDEGIKNDGTYSATAGPVAANLLAGAFVNPFDGTLGANNAWEDRAVYAGPPSARSGLVSYADSSQATYNVKGYGRSAALALVLSPGP